MFLQPRKSQPINNSNDNNNNNNNVREGKNSVSSRGGCVSASVVPRRVKVRVRRKESSKGFKVLPKGCSQESRHGWMRSGNWFQSRHSKVAVPSDVVVNSTLIIARPWAMGDGRRAKAAFSPSWIPWPRLDDPVPTYQGVPFPPLASPTTTTSWYAKCLIFRSDGNVVRVMEMTCSRLILVPSPAILLGVCYIDPQW